MSHSTAPRYYFEDFSLGRIFDCGPHVMTREAIIAFASEFDPQLFHIDEAAAEKTFFGALVASGWHTASTVMRLVCDGFLLETAGLGAPGVEELKWIRPVRAGDAIAVRVEVIDRKESRTRPDLGLVRFRMATSNQRGEIVMTQENWVMIARRSPGART